MGKREASGPERRAIIAAAGMRIIARDGLRALTHRAVDSEAGLAQGSSSYYVPTRSALIELIVRALAERSIAEAEEAAGSVRSSLGSASGLTVDGFAGAIAGLVETFASRAVEMRTRYALLLELDTSDPLHTLLSSRSPVQQQSVSVVGEALAGLGVEDASARAAELLALAEALLAHRVVVGDTSSPVTPVVASYLRGVVRAREQE